MPTNILVFDVLALGFVLFLVLFVYSAWLLWRVKRQLEEEREAHEETKMKLRESRKAHRDRAKGSGRKGKFKAEGSWEEAED